MEDRRTPRFKKRLAVKQDELDEALAEAADRQQKLALNLLFLLSICMPEDTKKNFYSPVPSFELHIISFCKLQRFR